MTEKRKLLAARPDVTSVGIPIQRTTLDPATATIQVATPRYVYERRPRRRRGGIRARGL